VSELSDANLRAILAVLLRRAGGTLDIPNTELYDAMMSDHGTRAGQFIIEETGDGIRLRTRAEDKA